MAPQGSKQIKHLQDLLNKSVSADEYDRLNARCQFLERELQIRSSRVHRLLVAAGADLNEGEDKAIRKIEMLAARTTAAERDISVSLSVIRLEVTRGGTINLNSCAMDDTGRGLCRDIQKVLSCFGAYNGQIDGDHSSTLAAVKRFQEEKGIAADGIIGNNTLREFESDFQRAKSH